MVITIYNNVYLLFVPVRLFSALQYGGIVPHEWIAAKGLLPNFPSAYNACHLTKSGQDIVDDYFPAHPAAKISSALYEYKGALTPLLEGRSLKMAEMSVGRVTPPTILWVCLHPALSHLLRYHCQNIATTGLLAKVVLLKSTLTSTG